MIETLLALPWLNAVAGLLVGVVVGLPVHADGTDSRMSVEVERFGTWLAGETGLPVVFHDERYSSREVLELRFALDAPERTPGQVAEALGSVADRVEARQDLVDLRLREPEIGRAHV
mgnify:CR=1 FL=1